MVMDLYKKFKNGAINYKKGLKLHDERGIVYQPSVWKKSDENKTFKK